MRVDSTDTQKQGQHVPPSQPTLDDSGAEEAALWMLRSNTHRAAGPGYALNITGNSGMLKQDLHNVSLP